MLLQFKIFSLSTRLFTQYLHLPEKEIKGKFAKQRSCELRLHLIGQKGRRGEAGVFYN